MPNCKNCNTDFAVSEKEKAIADGLQTPVPTTCRLCRMRALMATRNEWKLYKRKCDSTGEMILSAYHPDSPFTVYRNDVWWGNSWSGLDFGREFDFNRPFFEQFAELQKVVPREGTSVFNSENCEYNSHLRESRNCYLNSLVFQCEDLYYSYWMVNDKDVFDSMYTRDAEVCYECSDVNKAYGCVGLEESSDCDDCHFSYQLRGCKHCLFCTNMSHQKYQVFDQPCSKEAFEIAKQKVFNGSYEHWQKVFRRYKEMREKTVHRYVHNINCENVRGDHLYNCRNCFDCYESFDSEDTLNSISLSGSKMTYNAYSAGWPGCEAVYQSAVIRGSKDIAFSTYIWNSGTMRYCDSCASCDNCFGCIGLRHKSYCVFNKQYNREDYENLKTKIIEHMKKTGEWGQFFPPNLSPFAYNETAAQDFFPLTKKEAVKLGWEWREKDKKEYQPATLAEIPDNISDVKDDITKEILTCVDCSKNYKIIPQELKFYRQLNLPIPRQCPACRHKRRFDRRNGYELFKRQCGLCEKEIMSTYSSDRSEKVYCRECFYKTVY